MERRGGNSEVTGSVPAEALATGLGLLNLKDSEVRSRGSGAHLSLSTDTFHSFPFFNRVNTLSPDWTTLKGPS